MSTIALTYTNNAWFEALDYWLKHAKEGNIIIAEATNREHAQISTDGLKLFTLEDNLRNGN